MVRQDDFTTGHHTTTIGIVSEVEEEEDDDDDDDDNDNDTNVVHSNFSSRPDNTDAA